MSLKGGQWKSHVTASELYVSGETPKMGIPGEYRVETHESYAGVYRLFWADSRVTGHTKIGAYDPVQFFDASAYGVHMANRFDSDGANVGSPDAGGVAVGWWYHPHSDQVNSVSQGSYGLLNGYWAWFKVAGTAYIGAVTDVSDGENIYLSGEIAIPIGSTLGGTAVTPYPVAGAAVGASATIGQAVKVVISCAS